MQAKLTLRVEEALIRKAKQLARKRGTSVSRIFGDFIAAQNDELPSDDLPPITASMIGAARKLGANINESDYGKHLEDKYL
ncbi:MAG: DUF6364 family protein [Opitutaceae bacterium]